MAAYCAPRTSSMRERGISAGRPTWHGSDDVKIWFDRRNASAAYVQSRVELFKETCRWRLNDVYDDPHLAVWPLRHQRCGDDLMPRLERHECPFRHHFFMKPQPHTLATSTMLTRPCPSGGICLSDHVAPHASFDRCELFMKWLYIIDSAITIAMTTAAAAAAAARRHCNVVARHLLRTPRHSLPARQWHAARAFITNPEAGLAACSPMDFLRFCISDMVFIGRSATESCLDRSPRSTSLCSASRQFFPL